MRPSKLRLPESTDATTSLPFLDRLGNLGGKRARVADAGGASVADGVELELLEVLVEPGVAVVLGHHLRAGRERCLHPRLHHEAALDRGSSPTSPAATITDGFDVLVQLVIAAMTTEPWVNASADFLACVAEPPGGSSPGSAWVNERPASRQVDAILRALGTGHARLDGGEIELERVGVRRLGCLLGMKEPLLAAVSFDERDLIGRVDR